MHLTVELDSGYELRMARGRSLIRLSLVHDDREIEQRKCSDSDLRAIGQGARRSLFQGTLQFRRRRKTIWIHVAGTPVTSLPAQLLDVALDLLP